MDQSAARLSSVEYQGELTIISRPWHIFKEAGSQIIADYDLLTKHRSSAVIDDEHTVVYNQDNIFLEEGVQIKAAILNAENGPIYLGKNSSIEELISFFIIKFFSIEKIIRPPK